MNPTLSKARVTPSNDMRLLELREPMLCALPDFIKIPAIPGLPTELTGTALQSALQEKAEASVSIRRP